MSLLMRATPAVSADLFHAIPLEILDPFLYAEHDGRKVAVTGVLERDRIEALGLGIEVLDPFSLGLDTLLEQGVGFLDAEIEIDLRACKELGLESAIVPPDFPLAWADKLRGAGVELRLDADAFDLRRRVKNGAQLAGIRRAQVAADAAMAAAAELLRELPAGLT
jgi:Xaa-Pro aminopeptidase